MSCYRLFMIEELIMRQSNILVIEDDDIVARTIERCLRGKEYYVNVANSGVAGLKAAHRKVPDLVILDVIMPGMDGFTVCKEMREDPILEGGPHLIFNSQDQTGRCDSWFELGS